MRFSRVLNTADGNIDHLIIHDRRIFGCDVDVKIRFGCRRRIDFSVEKSEMRDAILSKVFFCGIRDAIVIQFTVCF